MKNKTIIFTLIILIFSTIVNAAGLGVAPATLKYENALKGATTEKQLSIQNPGDEPILTSITVEGEMKEWIEFSPEGKIEVPAKGSAKIIVKLTPPDEKPNGEYTAKFKVRAEGTADTEGSGMGLLPGVDTNAIATITDEEIIAGKVDNILTKDEKYGTPVIFRISFINLGNVPAGPEVKIDIEKRGTGIIDTIEKTLEEIKPGADKNYEIKWDTKGKEKDIYYRANIAVSLFGEILEEKEGVGFRVLGEESAAKAVEKPKNTSLLIGSGIIAAIVIIGLAIYLIFSRKKQYAEE